MFLIEVINCWYVKRVRSGPRRTQTTKGGTYAIDYPEFEPELAKVTDSLNPNANLAVYSHRFDGQIYLSVRLMQSNLPTRFPYTMYVQ